MNHKIKNDNTKDSAQKDYSNCCGSCKNNGLCNNKTEAEHKHIENKTEDKQK